MGNWRVLVFGIATTLGACGPVADLPSEPLNRLASTAESRPGPIHIAEMYAWNDSMPIQQDEQGTRHLRFTLEFQNAYRRPVNLALLQVFISLSENELGELAIPLSIESESLKETGLRSRRVPPLSTEQIGFRGRNLYPGVGEGRRLFLTLCLDVDGERVWLRQGSSILITQ